MVLVDMFKLEKLVKEKVLECNNKVILLVLLMIVLFIVSFVVGEKMMKPIINIYLNVKKIF